MPCVWISRTVLLLLLAVRIVHGPRHRRHLGPPDRRRRQLRLLSRDALTSWPASGRAGHPVGRHGRVRHVVPEGRDAARDQRQGGTENFQHHGETNSWALLFASLEFLT